MTTRTNRWRAALALAAATITGLALAHSAAGAPPAAPIAGYVPPIKHVFVINIENKGYDTTWGPTSAAPYLAKTLRAQGVLLNTYYGTAHNSQPNYIAQISGQGPNPQMQADCQIYSPFVGARHRGARAGGRQRLRLPGSRWPRCRASSAAEGLTWKGYMEDMGTPCRHPALGAVDDTQTGQGRRPVRGAAQPVRVLPRDHRLARPAPSGSSTCSHLPTDLAAAATTPNLCYITPNLCDDGHDAPCVDGRPGGLASVDAWLQTWVPKILNSPAFKTDGDAGHHRRRVRQPAVRRDAPAAARAPGRTPRCRASSGSAAAGSARWCSRAGRARTPGARRRTTTTRCWPRSRTIFGLPYLGYAQTAGLNRFGLDVYNTGWTG